MKWVEEEVKQTEAHSAGSKDVEGGAVFSVVAAAAAAAVVVSEPEFDSILPVSEAS